MSRKQYRKYIENLAEEVVGLGSAKGVEEIDSLFYLNNLVEKGSGSSPFYTGGDWKSKPVDLSFADILGGDSNPDIVDACGDLLDDSLDSSDLIVSGGTYIEDEELNAFSRGLSDGERLAEVESLDLGGTEDDEDDYDLDDYLGVEDEDYDSDEFDSGLDEDSGDDFDSDDLVLDDYLGVEDEDSGAVYDEDDLDEYLMVEDEDEEDDGDDYNLDDYLGVEDEDYDSDDIDDLDEYLGVEDGDDEEDESEGNDIWGISDDYVGEEIDYLSCSDDMVEDEGVDLENSFFSGISENLNGNSSIIGKNGSSVFLESDLEMGAMLVSLKSRLSKNRRK